MEDFYNTIREKLSGIIDAERLRNKPVLVRANPLSPSQAIGNPEDEDYPLLKGKEVMIQADFMGSSGHAFTDMAGNFQGTLDEIISMELNNNFRRAVFISTLNAMMKHLGLADKTMHCRDDEPKRCSLQLVKTIEEKYGHPKIAFVGFQPGMIRALSEKFELKVTDMDPDNIGKEKFGVIIDGPDKTGDNLAWCDIALVTGTTAANGTLGNFLGLKKPVIFYGVTISGTAKLLELDSFCTFGH